jgi:hypothetical protein
VKCGQHECGEEASTAFVWPGDDRGPQPVCVRHQATARAVARALGFTLHETPFAEYLRERARRAVALLKEQQEEHE